MFAFEFTDQINLRMMMVKGELLVTGELKVNTTFLFRLKFNQHFIHFDQKENVF